MSRDGSISFEWADGEKTFRLALGQLRELQEKCDAGPPHIYHRLESDTWLVDDVVETLRLGLIGGGADQAKARTLVQRYAGPGTFMENVRPAMMIIAAALVGAPDEAPKKAMGETETDPAFSPMTNGDSPSSTAMVQ